MSGMFEDSNTAWARSRNHCLRNRRSKNSSKLTTMILIDSLLLSNLRKMKNFTDKFEVIHFSDCKFRDSSIVKTTSTLAAKLIQFSQDTNIAVKFIDSVHH
jgi:hypothetical protein